MRILSIYILIFFIGCAGADVKNRDLAEKTAFLKTEDARFELSEKQEESFSTSSDISQFIQEHYMTVSETEVYVHPSRETPSAGKLKFGKKFSVMRVVPEMKSQDPLSQDNGEYFLESVQEDQKFYVRAEDAVPASQCIQKKEGMFCRKAVFSSDKGTLARENILLFIRATEAENLSGLLRLPDSLKKNPELKFAGFLYGKPTVIFSTSGKIEKKCIYNEEFYHIAELGKNSSVITVSVPARHSSSCSEEKNDEAVNLLSFIPEPARQRSDRSFILSLDSEIEVFQSSKSAGKEKTGKSLKKKKIRKSFPASNMEKLKKMKDIIIQYLKRHSSFGSAYEDSWMKQ
ncbi:MAG TPA: hypothetical protein PKV80_15795 [Leptospiraceae bacterium]|nr:hypothetical protein [Leptospiraceae bacterium]HNO21831.1 hypothetical protein [Leptospiraceae bacterium]